MVEQSVRAGIEVPHILSQVPGLPPVGLCTAAPGTSASVLCSTGCLSCHLQASAQPHRARRQNVDCSPALRGRTGSLTVSAKASRAERCVQHALQEQTCIGACVSALAMGEGRPLDRRAMSSSTGGASGRPAPGCCCSCPRQASEGAAEARGSVGPLRSAAGCGPDTMGALQELVSTCQALHWQTNSWPRIPRCALFKPLSRKFLQACTAQVAMLLLQSHLIKLGVSR